MYGPAASSSSPSPIRPGARQPGRGGGKRWLIRLFFASFPVWSLGMLAWVPSLRFAVIRRRPLDWAVFGGMVALTVLYLVVILMTPEDPEGAALVVSGLFIFGIIGGSTAHAIIAEPPVANGAGGHGYPPPGGAPTAYPGRAGAYGSQPGPYGQQGVDPYTAQTMPYGPGQAGGPYAPTHGGHQPPPGHVPPGHVAPGQVAPAPVPQGHVPQGQVPPGPGPADSSGTGSDRMRQVASELEELDELLRRRDGDR